MADDDHSGKAGRQVQGDRLREAWRVLLGHRDDTRPGGSPAFAGRGAPHPYAAVIGQLIGGLPNPAIVLDSVTRVIAFNEAAAGIVPALRRDEPALIALRMPELVDAIRRAGKTGEAQRVEFFERVPLDRWFEAFVTPVRRAGDHAGTFAASHRAILPGRCRRQPGARRHRTGAGAGQACAQPPWRPADHRQRARPGRDLHNAPAPAHRRRRLRRIFSSLNSALRCHVNVT